MSGVVTAVHRRAEHSPHKDPQETVRLLEGLGVEGDAHLGVTVQHRSRVAKDPSQPNLRQVHLIHAELHDRLELAGYELAPGELGENVTTRGIDLLALPTGTRLRLGDSSVVEVTGLRNPCAQLNSVRPGLMDQLIERDEAGGLIRLAGIMGVVLVAGEVRASDPVAVVLPDGDHRPLEPV
jgi:MOSC domain-containing protein YiiM